MKRILPLIYFVFGFAGSSFATELGRSTYGAASAIDFGAAVVPEMKGLHLRTDVAYYEGDLTAVGPGGFLSADAQLSAWIITPRFLWSTGLEFLGARHGFYVSLPFASGSSEADITTRLPGQAPTTTRIEDSETNLGDLYVTPMALAWRAGDWLIKWTETLTIPSGTYDEDKTLNVSRNHFTLLSALATTYRKGSEGFELNLRSGYLVNWENPETKYTSGDEVFVDGSLGWRFTPSFTLALTGYAYEQVTGDRGEGAVLGDFKGSVQGFGPAMRYFFSVRDQRFILIAKWIHETGAENRFEGDLFMISLVTSL